MFVCKGDTFVVFKQAFIIKKTMISYYYVLATYTP